METSRIADQLRRSLEGEAWHGPALNQLLEDVTAEQADARPAAGAHSIRELVLHTRAWIQAAGRMLDGENVDLSDSEDWPAGESGDWGQQVADLADSIQALASRVETLSEEQLEETVPGRDFSYYRLLHGVVQHNLYHAGQIAILKKC